LCFLLAFDTGFFRVIDFAFFVLMSLNLPTYSHFVLTVSH
jgi:hypothetical protein